MSEFDALPPSGFILSDAAMYAFECQEVFSDLLSFAVAIPDHLKPLFLIPVYVQAAPAEPSDRIGSIAVRVAEITPSGQSDAADLFSYQSFVNYDSENTVPSSEEESIWHDQQPDSMTRHQEHPLDWKMFEPDNPSYYGDGSSVDLFDEGYPYRSDHEVRHSSIVPLIKPIKIRIALKPEILQEHAPEKIKERADACVVRFISYRKPNRMYTFSVHCGNVPHMVRAVLSEVDEITMTCDCPFWRFGGPEFHAKAQKFLLGKPRGTAAPPDVRDPNREHWLCKHAYSVLRHLEQHVQQVVDEHWDLDDEDMLNAIDEEWDRLGKEVEVPLNQLEEKDPGLQTVEVEAVPETPNELVEEEEEKEEEKAPAEEEEELLEAQED